MLSKLSQFVNPFGKLKIDKEDMVLLIGVILISLLSFAMGYIIAQQQEKEPIQFEQIKTNNNL